MSTFADGLFQFGGVPVPIGGYSPMCTGKAIFVKPHSGSDKNTGKSPKLAKKTLAGALAAATANNGDVVYMIAESNTAANTTDYQSVALDWNKDGVHLVGVNNGSFIGQRSRISNLSTAAAMATGMFTVSANNCYIANLEIFQGTPASGTTSIAMLVSGQRNVFDNMQISGMGDLTAVADVAGSRSLKLSGSENLFRNCYIGIDTVLRATMTTEVEISAGARNIFESCHFETYTSLSTFKMISVATGCDRFVKFRNCEFHAVQNITSAVAPTGVIGITTMNGEVLLNDPYMFGFAQYVTADNAYVKILARDGTQTGHLMGIAGSIDAA